MFRAVGYFEIGCPDLSLLAMRSGIVLACTLSNCKEIQERPGHLVLYLVLVCPPSATMLHFLLPVEIVVRVQSRNYFDLPAIPSAIYMSLKV